MSQQLKSDNKQVRENAKQSKVQAKVDAKQAREDTKLSKVQAKADAEQAKIQAKALAEQTKIKKMEQRTLDIQQRKLAKIQAKFKRIENNEMRRKMEEDVRAELERERSVAEAKATETKRIKGDMRKQERDMATLVGALNAMKSAVKSEKKKQRRMTDDEKVASATEIVKQEAEIKEKQYEINMMEVSRLMTGKYDSAVEMICATAVESFNYNKLSSLFLVQSDVRIQNALLEIKMSRDIGHATFNRLYAEMHERVLLPREKATTEDNIELMRRLPLLDDNMCDILSFLRTNGIEMSEHERNEMVYGL